MLWFIVVGAQYSLLKSPQPDSCSPRHDFSKMNAYNRSFYFILISGTILLLNQSLQDPHRYTSYEENSLEKPKGPTLVVPSGFSKLFSSLLTEDSFQLYGFTISMNTLAVEARDLLVSILPYFPLIYVLGLLPQCNTLVMYIIEQLNIHAFGGSGKYNTL